MSEENQESDPYAGLDRETWFRIADRLSLMQDTHRQAALENTYKLAAWMIAQLFVANAGAITILKGEAPTSSLISFMVGLVAAMGCGLATWHQSHHTYHEMYRLSDPRVFASVKFWPTQSEDDKKSDLRAIRLAMGAGYISIAAFLIGAGLAISAL